jgi:homoprotocatechuate degradation regulator HpaR
MQYAKPLQTQLMRLRDLFMQRFRPHLLSHGLTEQKWRVVRALAQTESLSIKELGERCAIHPASLSRILPNLEKDRIIERNASRSDNRRVVVSLAPEGRFLFRRVAAGNDRVFEALVRDIGPARFDRAYRAIEDLIEVLSRRADESPPVPQRRRASGR